jgi:hypothetical protein
MQAPNTSDNEPVRLSLFKFIFGSLKREPVYTGRHALEFPRAAGSAMLDYDSGVNVGLMGSRLQDVYSRMSTHRCCLELSGAGAREGDLSIRPSPKKNLWATKSFYQILVCYPSLFALRNVEDPGS